MNKLLGSIALLTICAATPAFADAAQDAAMAPVHQFLDNMNKGDMKAAAAAYAPSAEITDEFAPYYWHGKTAFAQWGASFGAMAKAARITEPVMTAATPRRVSITKAHAYAIVPAILSFKQDGHPAREQGTFAFALTKAAHGWKIAAWAWTWERDLK